MPYDQPKPECADHHEYKSRVKNRLILYFIKLLTSAVPTVSSKLPLFFSDDFN
jgi:hypothetical protein